MRTRYLVKIWSYLSKIRKTGVQVLIGVNSNITFISLNIDPARNDEMTFLDFMTNAIIKKIDLA